MATLTSSLGADFTPAAGDFNVQASNGTVVIMRKQTSGAAFVEVGRVRSSGVIVSNPVAGAVYKLTSADATVAAQADQ